MKPSEVSILVVDDVQAMRVQVRGLLQVCGFEKVRIAASGAEACDLLLTQPFQMVIADWQMSPLNGIELLQYIRSHASLNGMAFIMLTAETTKEKVIEAITSGIDDYIVKPLTPDHIRTKVCNVLLKKQVI